MSYVQFFVFLLLIQFIPNIRYLPNIRPNNRFFPLKFISGKTFYFNEYSVLTDYSKFYLLNTLPYLNPVLNSVFNPILSLILKPIVIILEIKF